MREYTDTVYYCETCGFSCKNKKEMQDHENIHQTKKEIFGALRFFITDAHIKLMRKFVIDWQECEYGAPEINPKRPYGNSWVEGDIAKILNIEPEAEEEGEKVFSKAQNTDMYRLHLETKTALEIALQTGQLNAGEYARKSKWDDWHIVTSVTKL
jgi:hypothetical protein